VLSDVGAVQDAADKKGSQFRMNVQAKRGIANRTAKLAELFLGTAEPHAIENRVDCLKTFIVNGWEAAHLVARNSRSANGRGS
jgi:hypothetical protein